MKFEASGASPSHRSAGASLSSPLPLAQPATHADDGCPDATGPAAGPARIAFEAAEIRDLRADVARLRAERDKLLDTQRRVMELLNTTVPEKIIHDLRNVLNERDLYRTLADLDSAPD